MGLMPWAAQAPIPPVSVDVSGTTFVIATPTRGREVGDNYRRCVDELRSVLREQALSLGSLPALRDGEQHELVRPVLLEDPTSTFGLTGTLASPHDLVHTRDRAIRMFVETSRADWLLFWDDDVWTPLAHIPLANMLTVAALHNAPLVGALYPAKRLNEQALVRAAQAGKPNPLRHAFTLADMRFTCPPDWKASFPHPWLMSVLGVGFGFFLLSRPAAIILTERYRATRSFKDRLLGGETVSLCHKLLEDGESYSEDYAFCVSARKVGFDVHAYIGPGSPMVHDGCFSFAPHPDTLKDGAQPGSAR